MTSLSKLLAGSVAFAVTAGLIAAAGPAGASTAHRGATQHASRAAVPAWERAVEQLKAGIPAAGGSAPAGCPAGTTQVKSTSWAGYVACPRSAADRFGARDEPGPKLPMARCAHKPCRHVTGIVNPVPDIPVCDECGTFLVWVGFGGDPAPNIEQAGWGAVASGNAEEYFTWWEMSPGTIQVKGTTVRPGDQISASVQETGTTYTLSVTDSTHPANSFTATATCGSCASSTADWVAERAGTGAVPDFGTVHITGATAQLGLTSGGISAFPHAEFTLVNRSGKVLVQPGQLSGAGNGFTDVWKAGS